MMNILTHPSLPALLNHILLTFHLLLLPSFLCKIYLDRTTLIGLDADILRDSLDPGAADVMAAGSKLPPPVAMNTLLYQYSGPVLVAQGAKDPLNDAVSRSGNEYPWRRWIMMSIWDNTNEYTNLCLSASCSFYSYTSHFPSSISLPSTMLTIPLF